MSVLLYFLLFLAFAAYSRGDYCVCKPGNPQVLQKAIDYACGNGADCTAIQSNGACYNPNTVQDHCSYAVNSYYQKKAGATGSCDFSGAAMASASPPSTVSSGCVYPSGGSGGGTTPSTTPTTGTPTTTPTTGTPPSTPTGTPTTGTPTTGTPTSTTGTPSSTTGTPSSTTGTSPTVFGLGPSGSGTGITDTGSVAPVKASTNLLAVASFTLGISGLLLIWA